MYLIIKLLLEKVNKKNSLCVKLLITHKLQFSSAHSTTISCRIHSSFSFILLMTSAALVHIYISLRQWLTVGWCTDFLTQCFEILIAVPISFPFYMKMIMAEFMFNNLSDRFNTVYFPLFFVHFNIMTAKHIAPTCRAETVIKPRLMFKRLIKMSQ